MMLSLVCLLELRITLHATAFNGGRLRALLLPPEAAVEALLMVVSMVVLIPRISGCSVHSRFELCSHVSH
jgi:hypothetical protein